MANILVVDDDFDTTEVFSEMLRGYGHEVRTANSGEEGLRVLRGAPLPDVIVLDDDMGRGMSGPAMMEQMAIHDGGEERVPVILMSGSLRLREVGERIRTPYVLAKPGSLEVFVALLDRALADQQARSTS